MPGTDQLATANNNRDLLTTAIGPTVGYHISQCAHGGYIITVDGRIHAACTSLVEAMAAMGRVAAAQYNETAEPPERATDVTPDVDRMPRVLRPVPDDGVFKASGIGAGVRESVVLVLVMLAALAGSVVGA